MILSTMKTSERSGAIQVETTVDVLEKRNKVTPENNNKDPSLTEGMFLEFGISTHLSNSQ